MSLLKQQTFLRVFKSKEIKMLKWVSYYIYKIILKKKMKGLNNIIKTIDGVKFDSPFFRAPILICGDVETVCSWE